MYMWFVYEPDLEKTVVRKQCAFHVWQEIDVEWLNWIMLVIFQDFPTENGFIYLRLFIFKTFR